MTFSLLYVWIDGVDTIRVVFPANFSSEFPYDPFELISFAILGYYCHSFYTKQFLKDQSISSVICGVGGCFYISILQVFKRFLKNSKRIQWLNKFKLDQFYEYTRLYFLS